ncbi:GIY-YIG nuclease family protein [Patescibacteria group bacterium]
MKTCPGLFYILLCDQKTYYVGITSNLEQRLKSHNSGYNLATKRFSEIKLVYKEFYNNRKRAEKREAQVKRWSRAKKKALIDGNKNLLILLSKSRSSAEE